MIEEATVDAFIAHWRETGGSELANTQSFINGLCALIGVVAPHGSRTDDAHNDYVYERRVFQDNGDGTESFGRIDAYKRGCFILEAKQGSEGDRASLATGSDDIDLFGQTAAARVKRGTARRGTPGWTRAMVQAKGQAERYAKALPTDHGWPPILMVADIGYCIEVYADFTGTGKAYAQFPDRGSFRIMLDDLRDPKVRERLRAIWEEPQSLDPTAIAAAATRDIANLLATLARRLEARGHSAERVSAFLMRLLFTMFAEDTHLIPERSFSDLLARTRANPEHLHDQLTALWTAMDKGEFAPALGVKLRIFNGYLFKDREAIPLERAELDVLIEAASADWTQVEPAIFGTLLERALDPKERAKLGAHHTPRAYVERLVMPTVIEPLRADWNGVRTAATQLIDEGKTDDARREVERFHSKLAQTRVLDPACGTGNFLYVAMARMKELEGEVVELLTELGDDQYVAELSGHTITPDNFLGIEINPRAAAIAQLVLWIGYLQWHFRVAGKDRMPAEPILKDIRTIENRDALIEWDDKVLERDEAGMPVTRWDGETTKPHPVTRKPVPDGTARVGIYRYVSPRAARWPKADFIVGNPPFIGGKDVRNRLGDGYFEALFRTTDVPESADFVMHWWDKAASALRRGGVRRFGFVTTNSVIQTFSRRVVAKHLDAKDGVSILFGIADHPWVNEQDGASVRIAMTVAEKGQSEGRLLTVADEKGAPDHIDFATVVGKIRSNIGIGSTVTSAVQLKSNAGLGFQGVKLHGEGFIIESDLAQRMIVEQSTASLVVKPYRNGSDITRRAKLRHVIDLFAYSEADARCLFPGPFQHLLTHVKPERDTNRREIRKKNWWLFGENVPALRHALLGLDRYIVTVRTAKHRAFVFLKTDILPESRLVPIAISDAYHLGILTSRLHGLWALGTGAMLEDRPNYNNSEAFDPFPFPAGVPDQLVSRIRAEAESLDSLRKRVLAEHEDLTLTALYNVLEALREGRALTPKERGIHDRGLVTLIRQHHDAIDAAVAEAYGWPTDLDDEEILTRLVALNKERAAEEATGLVRWLRPEFQAPGAVAPVSGTLDLGDAPAGPTGATILPWPKSLPDQVSAVAQLLAGAGAPMSSREVARAFAAKRQATVTPVLDALAAIGQARRLADGRYAA